MKTSSFPFSSIGLVLLVLAMAARVRGDDQSGGFRFENITPESVKIWEGERPVLTYNHGNIHPPAGASGKPRSAYVHPIYGLDGEILTGDFIKDHDYHRGLFWGWSHIKIDGQEYDSWSLRRIETRFQKWLTREAQPKTASLAFENGWFVADKRVMTEQVKIEVQPATEHGRNIDVELTWTPTDRPITLSGAPGKSYGGFTLRFGQRSKTIITVPSGRTKEDLLMTNLPWADFSGDLSNHGRLTGAAIFVHPGHPNFPPTWMTRHYGVLAVGWPGVEPQTFQPGKPVSAKYRLWVHRGNPEAAEIQKQYETFAGK